MKYKIYCINLFERPDRYTHMKKQFDKFNITVKFIRNHKHKLGGRYGCFESHIQCLQDAFKSNLDFCLVLEDDIELDEDYQKVIDNCIGFIKRYKKTDIIYANGRFNLFIDVKYSKNIYSGKSVGADAIFITRKFICKILSKYPKYIGHYHYDTFLYLISVNSFISIDYICKPVPSVSDNDWNNCLNFMKDIQSSTTIHLVFLNFISVNGFRFLILTRNNFLKNIIIRVIKFIVKKTIKRQKENIKKIKIVY